jgi:RNA polymerase sigma-70 factor (ECF subfamily)
MPDSPSVSDDELLERLSQGNEQAFGELYDRYAPRLFAVALRLAGERAAEEALVEGFADVVRNARSPAAQGSVGARLIAAVRTRALSVARAAGRRRPSGKAPSALGTVEESLRQLGVAEREVIELAGDGLSEAEIARQLEESPATVRMRLRGGMEKLRATLTQGST